MRSFSLVRAASRPLFIISFCVIFLGLTSFWAVNHQAADASNEVTDRRALTNLGFFDKGGITPAATTITVNSTSDIASATDGLCTLREAITAANSNAASGAVAGECSAGSGGSDTIDLTTVTGTINLAGVLPDIASDMSINGPGSSQLTVRRNTSAFYRIFNITSGTVALSGLTVRDGRTADAADTNSSRGAGIQNLGTLTMNDVTVTANQTGNNQVGSLTTGGARGGGIYNEGTLTMTSCSVTGNVTGNSVAAGNDGGDGGGIFSFGTLTINHCVVSGNTTGNAAGSGFGGRGGGIRNGGTLVVTNSTISNNVTGDSASGTGGSGGGIYNASVMTLINSTISGNSTGGPGSFGGGIGTQGGTTLRLVSGTITGNLASNDNGDGVFVGASTTVLVRNTIIAGNGSAGLELMGTFTSQGHNLIGRDGGNGFSNGVNGDQVGTIASPLNPLLGPLANNGGPTMTHALLSNSTALDAGDNCVADPAHCGDANISQLTTDQRGTIFNRLVDGPDVDSTATVDIGAYETQAPLANLPDISTNEDTQVTAIFDGGDTSTITSVTATSDNPTLVPNDVAHLSAAMTGSTGIVTINPAANLSGTTNITVTVNRTGGPEMKTFMLTVNAVNDAPSFVKGADQTVNEDAGSQTVANWATAISRGAGDEIDQTVTFQVTGNTNTALFSAGPAIDAFGELTYTPAANANGSATITINLKDNGGTANGGVDTSAPQSFNITLNPRNDAPSFTKGLDQTVNEDAGPQSVSNWATAISPGPANESGQTVSFQILGNTAPGLFATAPAISSTGTLTYTSAANTVGTATITINLKDDGGTANGGFDTSASTSFTISVNSVNDAPSFTKGANQTINEDPVLQTVDNWATNISPGPGETGQTVSFTATNDNNALFSTQPAIGPSGNLSYRPANNANGIATVTVTLKDNGGTANGGVDTSAPQTFTITVNAVNDAPFFTKGTNQTVLEDAGAQTVANWATSIFRGGGPDELGQTLTFQVTNNTNAALFSSGPAISSTGTLTYTPAADANGSATLTINLKDDGGTANGGVDTSASQTFTITVNAINDAPSFTIGPDQTANNNAGPQSVPNWATNISAGPADESSQIVDFQITAITNVELFTAGSLNISSTGTLNYTPAPNAGGTATITVRLFDFGGQTNGGVDVSPTQTFHITVLPVDGTLNFSAANYNTTESSGFTTVTVNRTGDLTRAVAVDYASSGNNGLPCSTANGVATPKCDFTTALGTLNFGAGETSKTVNILISQDGFVEGPETFTISLTNPTNNVALGTTSTATVTIADDATEPSTNVIDDARNFVRQHYHDFLNREPDQSGWDFWTNQITSCGADAQCNEVRRIDVSASFFLSIEFQQTGYLVERFYKVAYGDATGSSSFVNQHQLAVPIVQFNEFMTDTQRIGKGVIVLAPGWEQALENNKQAYALEFVQTNRFITALPTSMTPSQFVTRLNQNTGGVLTLSEQQTVINLFGGAGNTANVNARAQAVRMVADDADLFAAESNRAFVLAEYFGYLRRNPNDAPDTDYTGYDFWLTKLNQFNGNYINAEMVKAFLSSIEYRQRFGQ